MQRQAIHQSRDALVASQTAMDVRRALAGTRAGRAYLYALWGSFLLLLAVAHTLPGGGKHFGIFAGYFALAATRELITLRETFTLDALAAERAREL
jgi:hypothetical protein